MPAKTTKERVAALRQRRIELGLTRIELYARPSDHAAIKRFAEQLESNHQTDMPSIDAHTCR